MPKLLVLSITVNAGICKAGLYLQENGVHCIGPGGYYLNSLPEMQWSQTSIGGPFWLTADFISTKWASSLLDDNCTFQTRVIGAYFVLPKSLQTSMDDRKS